MRLEKTSPCPMCLRVQQGLTKFDSVVQLYNVRVCELKIDFLYHIAEVINAAKMNIYVYYSGKK